MLDYCLDLSEKSYMRVYTAHQTDAPFPFCLWENGYFEAGPDYFTRRDGKPAVLYLYTLSGEGSISWRGQTAVLSSGTAVLIGCEEAHAYKTVSDNPWCFYWAHFTGSGLCGVAPFLMDRLTPVQVNQPMQICDIFERLDSLHSRTDRFVFAYRSSLINELLLLSIRCLEQKECGHTVGPDELRPAKDYIRDHLTGEITVDQLAAKCSLSKYHFIRTFHKSTGFSPYRYVQIMRIDRAKELLIFTNRSIGDIAASVGFRSPANFGKVFREITGTTPAAYRKEQFCWSE